MIDDPAFSPARNGLVLKQASPASNRTEPPPAIQINCFVLKTASFHLYISKYIILIGFNVKALCHPVDYDSALPGFHDAGEAHQAAGNAREIIVFLLQLAPGFHETRSLRAPMNFSTSRGV